MSEVRAYYVYFSRTCPHGIALSLPGQRAVKGVIRLLERSEEGARDAAAFMLDAHCVIDRVSILDDDAAIAAAAVLRPPALEAAIRRKG